MGENLVVVIDDNEDSLELARALLELHGHEVTTFTDANSALIALRTMSPPCVIVVDLCMPLVDGADFIQRLREDPALAKLPVILMSGAYHQAARIGLPFMLKPIDAEALLLAVKEHCGTPEKPA